MERIKSTTLLMGVIFILCLMSMVSCDILDKKPEIDVESAMIESPWQIIAGEDMSIRVSLDSGKDVLESASISIDDTEMETTISYSSDINTYSISCTIPENYKGEYTLGLTLNSEPAYTGTLKIYQIKVIPESTDIPVRMDINGAYLLVGKGKVMADKVEEVRFHDIKGNIVPGNMIEQTNISEKYTFIKLEQATSYEMMYDDNDFTVFPEYHYVKGCYVLVNSNGLLLPLATTGMAAVSSISDNSFCFWSGENGSPLMTANVYEEDIPSEITDPEQLKRIHTIPIRNTEGEISYSDILKYGFHVTKSGLEGNIRICMNPDVIYNNNYIVKMPLISEANKVKESLSRVFAVGPDLMAVTVKRDNYSLYYADVDNRWWSKIGEWERKMSDNDWVGIAVQGNRAILLTSNRQYHIVSDRHLSTYDLNWGDRFTNIWPVVDPILNETGNYIYFRELENGNPYFFRSRINGNVLDNPEKLVNGAIGNMFHVLDDIVVINSSHHTAEQQEIFQIITGGNVTAVTDVERFAGWGLDYMAGAILNPGRMQ